MRRVELMHLNRECVHPRLENLFVREDVTADVEAGLILIHREIERQLDVLRGGLPSATLGPHCREPHDCPFRRRCWAALPAHHVTTLHSLGLWAFELMRQGCETVIEVPPDLRLTPVAQRQQRAVRTGRMVVEPGLAEALGGWDPPLAFLDFETVSPAIPAWPGSRPYDPIPAQFSCHAQDPGGGWRHSAWLADGPGDPRPAIAEAVVAACRGSRTVVGYNTPFEKGCLATLAAAAPELASELEDIRSRLVDLMRVLRDHVYHPDFNGSFGLKSVLPVLVPELGYGDLEISNGDVASARIRAMLLEKDPPDPAERERLRAALLRHCERDTWATVKLHEKLAEL